MSEPNHLDPAQAAEIDRLAAAFAKDPRSKAFLPLSDEYIKAGMWHEAAAVLEDGLKVYPGFVTAMAALGRVYEQLAQPVKARAVLEEVVKLSPDNLRAHRTLAKIYKAQGERDLALQSCSAIVSANPDDEEAVSIMMSFGLSSAEISAASSSRSRRSRKRKSAREPQSSQERDAVAPLEPRPVSAQASQQTPDRASPQRTETAETIARLEAWLRTIQANSQTNR